MLAKVGSLASDEKERGVITVSAGNAAAAVAYACALHGIDCLVVMARTASEQKIVATRGYGASVDLEAPTMDEVFERMEELRRASDRVLVHPFDDPVVIEGHASLGREIIEDAPQIEVIVVPVGGGGLVSGVARGAPGARVVAVEPERTPALHAALAAGKPVRVGTDSVADALAAPIAGEHPLRICTEAGVESYLVSEDDIREGFRFLYARAKLAAEPGAGAAVGALLSGKVPGVEGKTVAVVVSGGNVSSETAAAILRGE
jgi:threonine dehydratase